MNKKSFNLDERERNVFHNLISVLYFITLVVLIGIQLYRQFVLGQSQDQWNDIAMLITFNVLFLLGGGLYLSGTLNLKNIRKRLHFVRLRSLCPDWFAFYHLQIRSSPWPGCWTGTDMGLFPDRPAYHRCSGDRLGSLRLYRIPAHGKKSRII